LVVIAIIGILASVVLANLNSARTRARDTKRVADIKQLQLALSLFYDANSFYPTTLCTGTQDSCLAPTYISVMPSDPNFSGTDLCTAGSQAGCYLYSGNGIGATCSSYHLGATLEDTNNQALSGAPHSGPL